MFQSFLLSFLTSLRIVQSPDLVAKYSSDQPAPGSFPPDELIIVGSVNERLKLTRFWHLKVTRL